MLHAGVVKKWMNEVGDNYQTYNFPPQLIFNMDETMIDSSGHKVKVLVRSGSDRPFTENEAKFQHITLVLAISASGAYVQLLAIFPLKTEPYLLPCIKGFFHTSGQQNGFIINEIWHEWVEKVFIPHVEHLRDKLNLPQQKALLLVDSHSTRKYEPTKRLFEQHNIFVKILPAHSSTILQPLDLTVNGEFKRLLRLRFKPRKGETTPTKRSRLMYTSVECLQGAFLSMHITDGFARAGLWPFSVEAPLNSTLVRHTIDAIDFAPPTKRKRGANIAGKVLTTGDLSTSTLPPTSPAWVIVWCARVVRDGTFTPHKQYNAFTQTVILITLK